MQTANTPSRMPDDRRRSDDERVPKPVDDALPPDADEAAAIVDARRTEKPVEDMGGEID